MTKAAPPRPPSARVRAQENPCYTTALARATHLKAQHMGAPPAMPAASTPLSSIEVRALGAGCDLDAGAMAELAEACASVHAGGP